MKNHITSTENQFLKLGILLGSMKKQNKNEKSLLWHIKIITACIENNQTLILKNRFMEYSSTALWANLSPESYSRILTNGPDHLQPEDINNGTETLMIALCVYNDTLSRLLHTLRDECFLNTSRITYFRLKNNQRIAKQISRMSCSIFFRRTDTAINISNNFFHSKEAAGFQQAARDAEETAQTLGELTTLAQYIPEIGSLPLLQALERLERPKKLRQYRLFHDPNGRLCGYISWAWLDSDLARQGVPPPEAMLPHQWNEGPCLLVCDAFATAVGYARVCADLAAGLYPGEPMYLRPNAPHGIAVQVSPMISNDFENLHGIHASVIDILALLRARLSQQEGVRA